MLKDSIHDLLGNTPGQQTVQSVGDSPAVGKASVFIMVPKSVPEAEGDIHTVNYHTRPLQHLHRHTVIENDELLFREIRDSK